MASVMYLTVSSDDLPDIARQLIHSVVNPRPLTKTSSHDVASVMYLTVSSEEHTQEARGAG
jgi:hypothetical protein